MLTVDPAGPSEVSQVLHLAAKSLAGVDVEQLLEACTRDTCMVARDTRGGDLLGFAVAARDAPCEGHILAFAVDRMHRGEGVGSALLSGLRDELLRRGTHRLRLEVRGDNRVAQAFYLRHGFEPEGLREHAFPDGADAVCLARPI